jgi:hypothetical protein
MERESVKAVIVFGSILYGYKGSGTDGRSRCGAAAAFCGWLLLA